MVCSDYFVVDNMVDMGIVNNNRLCCSVCSE